MLAAIDVIILWIDGRAKTGGVAEHPSDDV